jgi:3-dehydroquinate synthetase
MRTRLTNAMRLDKKVEGGKVKFVLADRIGHVEFGRNVSGPLIERALDHIQS